MNILEEQQELAGYFADCLIETKFVSGLDEAGYETIRQDLIEKINREISQVIFDNLTSDQVEEMENLLDDDDLSEISSFLKETIPDLRDLILRRLVDIKNQANY
jgi:uncharacterized membrane protein YheB (UPF0754 family)